MERAVSSERVARDRREHVAGLHDEHVHTERPGRELRPERVVERLERVLRRTVCTYAHVLNQTHIQAARRHDGRAGNTAISGEIVVFKPKKYINKEK